MPDLSSDDFDIQELLPWIEFGCWAMLAMTPLIWWLQGPSVSTDQFVVRTSIAAISAVGGVILRLRALIRRNRSSGQPASANDADSRTVGDNEVVEKHV